MKTTLAVLGALLVGAGSSLGLGANNNLQLNNTVTFGYDDNFYDAQTNKTRTAEFTEQPEIVASSTRENSYLALRYSPSYEYFFNPEILERQTLSHELDATWNQTLSPRLSFTLQEIFRRGIQPELLDRNNALVFPDESYYENTVNGAVSIKLAPSTRLDLSGRYYLFYYDNSLVGSNADYNIVSEGVTLTQDLSKDTSVFGSVNDDNTTYRLANVRGANTVSAGLGLNQAFGARVLGTISGGYQFKSFQLASINGQNSPNGNASLTYLFSPRLRLTAGGGYSLWEANIEPYASQVRTSGFANLAYDISTRFSFYLTGGITRGKYMADQAATVNGQGNEVVMEGNMPVLLTGQSVINGIDTLYQASARLSYQVSRHYWVDLNYSYTDVISELRPEFDKNIYSADWRISF